MQKIIRENPSVDVILPNYNKAEFLEETINSVITQSYKNWQWVVNDDSPNRDTWIELEKITDFVVDFKLHVYQEVKEKVKKIIN